MVINLESARLRIEGEMSDDVVISRQARIVTGVLDPDTGVYTPAGSTVLYKGPAIIRTYAPEPAPRPEGGEVVMETTYQIRIPLDTPEIWEGDVVVVKASLRDPGLVGQAFLVRSALYATFGVTRNLIAENRSIRLDP